MTFASIIVVLTTLARTSLFIIREVSLAQVKINGTSINDLTGACAEIIELDGQVCDPAVPAHIKAYLPIYETQIVDLRRRLTDLINANIDAFTPGAQDILRADVAFLARLMNDRKAR